ncbi:MAG: type II toxin-antitoxin system VapC family toxin [Terriglobales bacterium]
MTIHLDTNFLIRMRIPGGIEDHLHRSWTAAGLRLQASAIAWSEFLCGPLDISVRRYARQLLGAPVPMEEEDADLAAELFNFSGRRRGSLPDCQIAAIAIHRGASLATANRADFLRFTAAGLILANAS